MTPGPSGALGAGIVGLALLSGYALSSFVVDRVERRARASSALEGSTGSRARLMLQRGIPAFDGLSSFLLRRFPLVDDAAHRLCELALERGARFEKAPIVSLMLGSTVIVACLGLAITGSLCFGAAIGTAFLLGSLLLAKSDGERRDAALREQVPDAIRAIEASFRSGHSLAQTLEASSRECSGYLGSLFSDAARRLDLGASTKEALAVMCDNPRVPELSFIAVALDIQHQSGGSIGPVLESAMDTVQGELRLMRSLRIQTAQARLSATIVTVMPFLLVALFSMMTPDFLSPFFSSAIGVALLLSALTMQLVGVIAVRRMLRIEVA